jgi:hypothetical protein
MDVDPRRRGTAMRRWFVLVTVALGLAAAPTAEAAGIHNFRVSDAGSEIGWGITICTTPGLTVQFKLRLEDDYGVVDTNRGGGTQTYRCTRWGWGWADIFESGQYYGRIKVRIPATGFVRYTGWKGFYIR